MSLLLATSAHSDFYNWARPLLPLFWLVCLVLSIAFGSLKGRAGSGFLWGLLFGPFGLLVTALILPNLKKGK